MRRAPPPIVSTVQRARRHVPRPNPVAALYVYAVLLAPEAARKLHQIPNGTPILYIGQTGLTPAARFAQHKRGGAYGSDIVRHHGIRLVPELTSGPYPDRDTAERAERETAARLKAEGWQIAGGH